jgi:monovalent cation/hydrogen antiporter
VQGTLHEEIIASHKRLYREGIRAERVILIKVRDQGQIADEILREMERVLDLEEQRFQGEG